VPILARRRYLARGNLIDDPKSGAVRLLDAGRNTDSSVTRPCEVDVGQLGRQVRLDVVDVVEVVRAVLGETLDPPSEAKVTWLDESVEVDSEVQFEIGENERHQFVVGVVMQWHAVATQ
jgi:hypothetical protein